ncbi:hypothetical protein F3Y22_tig00110607pilonHSYRG00108 [Hibiscus syriacus]|uniref:Uncharacterized protein n=1 Tax=Hibiscus syriacus TaxID=106335 RepID=A0A6A3A0W2_HIBSY|nr:hypothetical protein F3Y22_tig00110607pilonHSYRG00108 [Hibiscus syriacus]
MDEVEVRSAGNGLYIFQFGTSAASEWVFDNEPWYIRSNLNILRKWEPNLPELDFKLDTAPMWVQLSKVPLELFTRKRLSYIASALGTLLCIDGITTSRQHLSFVKVCVEISPDFRCPNHIDVELSNGVMMSIDVVIPWIPTSCCRCISFLHRDMDCLNKGGVGDQFSLGLSGTHQLFEQSTQREDSIGSNEVVVACAKVGSVVLADVVVGEVRITCDRASSFVGGRPVQGGEVNEVVEIPVVQSVPRMKGMGKSPKEGTRKIAVETRNRFVPLLIADQELGMERRTRATSIGVTNLLSEIKSKKNDKVKKLKQRVEGGDGSSNAL